jgi:hypothetical protein
MLDRPPRSLADTRHPIVWSEARQSELRRVISRETPSKDEVDRELATILLLCATGDFHAADIRITDILHRNMDRCKTDIRIFTNIVSALFVVQNFDLATAMLRDKYEFPRELEIAAGDIGHSSACVDWQISEAGAHRFVFDKTVFSDDQTTHRMNQLQREFPLLAYYAAQNAQETGSVLLSQFDMGLSPGLAYCQSRPDFFLIPDCVFVPTRGYQYFRKVLREKYVRWQDREAIAFWRGSTTGTKTSPNDWRSLERIRLCQLAMQHRHTGLIDAGISQVVQFADSSVVEEIRRSGLMKGFVSWEDWGRYKYLIMIDGNSSPWSNMFQGLLTGAAVLKVESPRGLNQWFYDELIPWVNYVPIAPDRSDLLDKIRWLRSHDTFAEGVGQRGLELAERLTYERELQRSVPVISAAFRYFRGNRDRVAPFGWVE